MIATQVTRISNKSELESKLKISSLAKFTGDKAYAKAWIINCKSYFSCMHEMDKDEKVCFVLDNIDAGQLGNLWRSNLLDQLNEWADYRTTPENRRLSIQLMKPYTSWEDFEKKF